MNLTRVYTMLLLSVVLISLMNEEPELEEPSLTTLSLSPPELPLSSSRTATGTQNRLTKPPPRLRIDFYDGKCDAVQSTVSAAMARIVSHKENATAQLLRLMFHDCFIHGCDGSILLGNNTGNDSLEPEILAKASETLKGFEFVNQIKEELERICPGIVSCADILVLATRDGVNLSGGPYFTVGMGRRDSKESYYKLATAEIPRPNQNISETLRLFKLRKFSVRETVALLGAHNIGKMDCQFISPRLNEFEGTTQPDPTLSPEFLAELSVQCRRGSKGSIPSGTEFGPKYYERILQGRGLIAADQQLMANNETADLVREYANDPTGRAFLTDFAKAMKKMSDLEAIGGTQGEVRHICSQNNNDTSTPAAASTRKSAAAINFNISMFKSIVFILCLCVGKMVLAST